jgi:hypothetical protein
MYKLNKFKGAGISSAYQGIEKTIKKERLNTVEFVADVGFGATSGVLTGGIGSVGEVVASNVAKAGAKIGFRVLSGALAGMGSKVVNEIKEIATTEKKLKNFGQTLDKDGNVNKAGTIISWVSSATVGMVGVGSTELSSNLTHGVKSGLEKCLTRVAVSGTSAAVCDTVIQTANIKTGVQDSFNVKQLVTSTAVSSVVTAAQEGVKESIYSSNMGKYDLFMYKI